MPLAHCSLRGPEPVGTPFPRSFPTLETPRLVLRELRDDDVDALFAMFSDPPTMRYWLTPAWTSLDQAHASLAWVREDFAAGTGIRFGVVARDGAGDERDRVIGTCTLFKIDFEHARGEVGYALRRSEWGRGLMREAMEAVIAYAFDTLGLHRVEADLDPRNESSRGLLLRLGFREEGVLRQRYRVAGEIQDGLIMGLLAPEWRQNNELQASIP